MKTLYQASNALEAHMILHLLEQQGLSGRVDGEYLQGAIGELPAAGLVRVMVDEHDYAAAKKLVDQWDARQPAQEAPALPAVRKSHPGIGWGVFACGLVAGMLCTYAYFRTPVSADGIDHNGDGSLDEKWTYARSNLMMKSEIDRNLDGKFDYLLTYGRNGTVESAEFDDDFDGVFESRAVYLAGNLRLMEVDTDGDQYRDFKINYQHGVLHSNEYIYPASGLPQKIEYFKFGKLTHAEIDTDNDGKLDQRKNYDKLGEVMWTEAIK